MAPRLPQVVALQGPWIEEYLQNTSVSKRLHERALGTLPGGDTRTITYFPPHPVFMKEGRGCTIVDVDGNEYVDFVNNYTSLIHGHAHPEIVKALSSQAEKGWCFATPHEAQLELAEELTDRIGSMQKIRFCNSGTEATLSSLRAAKAFTKRNKVMKMEGGYHGTHDAAEISVSPPLAEAGPKGTPTSRAECEGLFRGVIPDVVVCPFNDLASAEILLRKHCKDLAAVIVEPILGAGGTLPAKIGFLQSLRDFTQSHGILLIFDEVITFRLATGGAQQVYGVEPDLTALGKTIGGGLPIGAFGGRSDVMALFDPRDGKMSHSGTFNGNALTMAAGVAALRLLGGDEIARINNLGDLLRNGLVRAFQDFGIAARVTGIGSLVAWHFTSGDVVNYRDVAASDSSLHRPLHLSLLNKGIFATPRGSMCISTPMGQEEIEKAIDAFRRALEEVKEFYKIPMGQRIPAVVERNFE